MDWTSMDLFDAIVASHSADYEDVTKFIDLVRTKTSDEENPVVIAGLTDVVSMYAGVSKFDVLETAISNSTYILLFVSQNYATNRDWYERFVHDCCLSSAIEDIYKRDCLIPIWVDADQPSYKKPFPIASITGWYYNRMRENSWDILKKCLREGIELRVQRDMERKELRELIIREERLRKEKRHQERMDSIRRRAAEAADVSPAPLLPDGKVAGSVSTASAATNLTVNINLSQALCHEQGSTEETDIENRHRPPSATAGVSDWSTSTYISGSTASGGSTSGAGSTSGGGSASGGGSTSGSGSTLGAESTSRGGFTARGGSTRESSQDQDNIVNRNTRERYRLYGDQQQATSGHIHPEFSATGASGVAMIPTVVNSSAIESVASVPQALRRPTPSIEPQHSTADTTLYASQMDLPSTLPNSLSGPQPLTCDPPY